MINHHNFAYEAGPTFPTAIGDRYYAQDLARDYWSKIDDAGKKVAGGFDTFPVLLKDSNITKGTLWTDINIPIARGIVKFEVDVPNSYAALPPTVTQEDVYCRIETTAEVDFDISGTATLDGATPNYIKVTYSETDGATRTRAKKAGSYVYEKAISYTITVDAVAPTDYDLCLGTLIGDGAASLIIESYTRTRHLNGSYDYVVETQEDWNIIIDYTAANQYRIKDDVKSIYVKYLAGGYQMTGATSPLQEGDAYGYIETNDCTRIVFEPGAFIDMHQNIGYLEIDTDYCYLDGVSMQGDKGAASAITRSFLLNANYVTFINCDSQTRLSDTDIIIFEGSGTASHNETSKVINCSIIDIDSSGSLTGFRYFYNLDNIRIYDIESTASDVYPIYDITNLKNCYIEKVDASLLNKFIYGLYNVINCSHIYMKDFDAVSIVRGGTNLINCTNIYMEDFSSISSLGLTGCTSCSNIYIYNLISTASVCYGINNSSNLSNCYCKQLDGSTNCYAFTNSTQLSNCYAEDIDSSGGNAYGFYDCDHVTGSKATTCDTGFYDCDFITGCIADTNSVHGFDACESVGESLSISNTTNGFNDCITISACVSRNNGGDGFNNCDRVMGSRAFTNTGNGFKDCNQIGGNRSTGNGTQYNNCFADYAGTVGQADSSAGGWNA